MSIGFLVMHLLDAVTWVAVESMDVIIACPGPYSCMLLLYVLDVTVVTRTSGE